VTKFLGILSFLAFLYLLVSIINPKVFLRGRLTRRKTAIASAVCFILFIVFVASGSSPSKSAAPLSTQTASPAPTASPTPAPTPAPSLTTEDQAQKDAEAKANAEAEANNPTNIVKQAVHKSFHDKNSYDKSDSILDLTYNPDNGFMNIRVFANDNLTEKMIKKGIWMDMTDVLKQLKGNENIKTVAFQIVMPLQDAYGKSSNDNVMKAEFTADTMNKIDFNNFNFDNIPKVANNYWEHPIMKKINVN
jgi:hypothetical protein